MGAGGPPRWRGVGAGISLQVPAVAGVVRAVVEEASAGDGGGLSPWRASSSWRCGASWRPGCVPEGAVRKEGEALWRCGVTSRPWGWWEATRWNFRACQASRRRDGVASHRPSSGRQKTQRASGDGRESPHGEQGDRRKFKRPFPLAAPVPPAPPDASQPGAGRLAVHPTGSKPAAGGLPLTHLPVLSGSPGTTQEMSRCDTL